MMRAMRICLALLVLTPVAALADEAALQLRLDHEVHSSEHVVRGKYDGGRLDPTAELKGLLPVKPVAIDRDEVELRPTDLAPGTPRMIGEGVFFLQKRFDGKGADAKRYIELEGVEGVAWTGTVAYLGYREGDDGKYGLRDLAKKADFEKLLGAALERDRLLAAALAIVDSKARAVKLVELVRTAHEAPEEVVAELGPDPVAQRAIVEIGLVHEVASLEELRRSARHAWVKHAAVRALAPAPDGEKRLVAIALAKESSEDEVVAAIEMLFALDQAGAASLEKLSFDSRPRVRRAVASALREKVKDLKTLERLMKDPDETVRRAATEAARAAARRLGLPLPGAKPDEEKDPEDR